jgi:SRSO17 transposase
MHIKANPTVIQETRRWSRKVGLSRPLERVLAVFVTGVLLAPGKRSLAAIGRTLVEGRYRGQLSRASRNPAFLTRDLYRSACAETLGALAEEALKREAAPRWILCIDDVFTTRGGETLVANGHHTRESKKVKAKYTSSKSHTFVQGLMITNEGTRVPLPRRTWRTKKYAKEVGKAYVTKIELAAVILRELKTVLDPRIEVVVLADTLYDTRTLMKECRKLGFKLIVPVHSYRRFADVPRLAPEVVRKIYAHGRSLPRSRYKRLVLTRGTEGTASYRRYSPNDKCTRSRTYDVSHEVRDVATLGDVGVTYSWKRKVARRRSSNKDSLKALVCSDTRMPPELVAELYELRWQIEIFFRDLKSGLGLADYTGQDFSAFERLVDLTLLSFLLLERHRVRGLRATADPKRIGELRASRTTSLKQEFEQESFRADAAWMLRRMETAAGRSRLRALLERLRARSPTLVTSSICLG